MRHQIDLDKNFRLVLTEPHIITLDDIIFWIPKLRFDEVKSFLVSEYGMTDHGSPNDEVVWDKNLCYQGKNGVIYYDINFYDKKPSHIEFRYCKEFRVLKGLGDEDPMKPVVFGVYRLLHPNVKVTDGRGKVLNFDFKQEIWRLPSQK